VTETSDQVQIDTSSDIEWTSCDYKAAWV